MHERLENAFVVHPKSRCWVWLGNLNFYGYGRVMINYRAILAHRLSYEFHKGKIPDGLVLDHLCRNTKCINPEHLEAVTHRVNLERSAPATKTHCNYGHPMDGRQPNGNRLCLTCRRKNSLRRYYERKAACLIIAV